MKNMKARITRKKKQKKLESSKKILIFSDILLSLVVLFTFIALFLNIPVEGIVQLDVALIGLSTMAHSFYFWKAKCENIRKNPDISKLIEQGIIDLEEKEENDYV